MKQLFVILFALSILAVSCNRPKVVECDGYNLIIQNGPTLGYSPESGVSILQEGNLRFKDLNRNGVLDPYEDWRLDVETRVEDLSARLSVEEIAGLMLYSNHQAIPNSLGYTPATWGGKSLAESGAEPYELSDQQKIFFAEDNMRHILITSVQSNEIAAKWNNLAQAFCEGLGHGIPSNNSTDPRHTSRADSEFNAGGGGQISMWPGSLGIAATFDPEIMREHARIASIEYRALGLATALSPQVDLGTEPRWLRFNGTLGEDPILAKDMAEAFCEGYQYSDSDNEIADGWGYQSVNAMVKHWPGGGTGEAGRDAHMVFGKYAVYPGNNFETHKLPFTEGAFKLKGETAQASAVMPYYTISYNQSDRNVANGFNYDIITRQLRQEHNYDGVVCTDWCITADASLPISNGRPHGVEDLSVAQRHYEVIKAGVDQFGGNNEKAPVLEAYQIGVQEIGQEAMMERMRLSAKRLLRNIMRPGLFENPYVDPAYTVKTVGNPEYMKAGYQAQLKSIVMLKNHEGTLPLKEGLKVYIPERHNPAYMGFWGPSAAVYIEEPISRQLCDRYFQKVSTPEEADVALVVIESPNSRYGYDVNDLQKGGNGYVPISLQYSDYTAKYARNKSLAGGDPLESFTNRSYKGKTVRTINIQDMYNVQNARKAMGDKPVVVLCATSHPFVMSEIEPYADAILLGFDVSNQAFLDIVSGAAQPSGLLPMQMPRDMRTVEEQAEDVPRDMQPYVDREGNSYDFAFGLNWEGKIQDERVEKYY